MTRLRPIWVLRVFLLANGALLILGLLIYNLTSSFDNIKSQKVNEHFGITTTAVRSDKAEDDEFKVPNVVHFIWYTETAKPLKFHQMLAVLAARKFIRPKVIYFHTNQPPTGKYWDHVKDIDTLKVTFRQPPIKLFGETLKNPVYYTSHSNVDRVKILMEYGGIYLDLDMIALQSFDQLRRHRCTIGREQKTKACGSVIVCSKDSPFLLLWMNSYFDDYKIDEWAYNSGQVPFNLALRFPHIVNMEETRLNRPNFMELDFIWGDKRFDWRNNYAVHLWYRLWRDQSSLFHGVEPNETNVGRWRGMFGEISRSILFDDVKFTDSKYQL